MNAYNPIASLQRLESAGFKRSQAESLANELHHATTELVTTDDLKAALDRQTIRLSTIVAALLAVAVTISKLFA